MGSEVEVALEELALEVNKHPAARETFEALQRELRSGKGERRP